MKQQSAIHAPFAQARDVSRSVRPSHTSTTAAARYIVHARRQRARRRLSLSPPILIVAHARLPPSLQVRPANATYSENTRAAASTLQSSARRGVAGGAARGGSARGAPGSAPGGAARGGAARGAARSAGANNTNAPRPTGPGRSTGIIRRPQDMRSPGLGQAADSPCLGRGPRGGAPVAPMDPPPRPAAPTFMLADQFSFPAYSGANGLHPTGSGLLGPHLFPPPSVDDLVPFPNHSVAFGLPSSTLFFFF